MSEPMLSQSIDPALMRIVSYPAEVLRRRAADVPEVTDRVREVAGRMVELMLEAPGIGLAAPQVGVGWRMFVAHVPRSERNGGAEGEADDGLIRHTDAPAVYINPMIHDPDGELEMMEEGCLSLPEVHGDVLRPRTVTITATGLDGERFTQRGTGLLARCWQHETDHLDGVLILDRMTQMSRLRNRAAIRNLERSADS